MSDGFREDHRGEAAGADRPPAIADEIAGDLLGDLLEGGLVAGSVPPVYDRVADLLKVAAGPPRPDELAGDGAGEQDPEPAAAGQPGVPQSKDTKKSADTGHQVNRLPDPAG